MGAPDPVPRRPTAAPGTRSTPRPARTAGALLAPVAPLAVGIMIMRGGGVPAGVWLLNAAAAAVGASMAAFALAWPGRATPGRGSLRWAVLCGVVLLGATLPADGTEGVHRWLAFGPVQLHAGALLLPSLLVALLETSWITSVIAAFATLGVLSLQPDAAQAASFCAAWIGVVAVRREKKAVAVIVASILLTATSLLRPDPLEPVPHVEGIVGMAAAQGLLLTVAAVASLAVLPLALAWFLDRHVGLVLATYTTVTLIAAWLGHHPVPVLGHGVSPILGYYGAVAVALLLGRSRPGTPALAPSPV